MNGTGNLENIKRKIMLARTNDNATLVTSQYKDAVKISMEQNDYYLEKLYTPQQALELAEDISRIARRIPQ